MDGSKEGGLTRREWIKLDILWHAGVIGCGGLHSCNYCQALLREWDEANGFVEIKAELGGAGE